MPEDDFTLISGEPKAFHYVAQSGKGLDRNFCPNCGATYNIDTMKPQKEGICDKCGKELIQRPDDRPETIENRLAVYQKDTAPLIEFYEKKGLLRRVQCEGEYQEVLGRLFNALEKTAKV